MCTDLSSAGPHTAALRRCTRHTCRGSSPWAPPRSSGPAEPSASTSGSLQAKMEWEGRHTAGSVRTTKQAKLQTPYKCPHPLLPLTGQAERHDGDVAAPLLALAAATARHRAVAERLGHIGTQVGVRRVAQPHAAGSHVSAAALLLQRRAGAVAGRHVECAAYAQRRRHLGAVGDGPFVVGRRDGGRDEAVHSALERKERKNVIRYVHRVAQRQVW